MSHQRIFVFGRSTGSTAVLAADVDDLVLGVRAVLVDGRGDDDDTLDPGELS